MNKCEKCGMEMLNYSGEYLCPRCDVAKIIRIAKLAAAQAEIDITQKQIKCK